MERRLKSILACVCVFFVGACGGGSETPGTGPEGSPEVLSISPAGGATAAEVRFTASVAGSSAITYKWDFGGAAVPDTSQDAAPMVVLGKVGRYKASLTVKNGLGQSRYDFDLFVSGLTLKGQIKSLGGGGVEEVQLHFDKLDQTVTSDYSGNWRVNDVPTGKVTITPVHADWVFDPAQRTVDVGLLDVDAVNFTFTGQQEDTENWVRTFTYDDSYNSGGIAFDIDAAGNIYCLGSELALVKYTPLGHLEWARKLVNESRYEPISVDVTSGGQVVLTALGEDEDGDFIAMIRLAPDGTGVRAHRIRGPEYLDLTDAASCGNGDIVVVGNYREFLTQYDALIARISGTGQPEWATGWGGGDTDSARRVCRDKDGNILVGGDTQSFNNTSGGAFVLKVGPSGELLWQKGWDALSECSTHDLDVDNSGNVLAAVACRSDYVDSSQEADAVVKYSPSGELIWSVVVGVDTSASYFDSRLKGNLALAVASDGTCWLADGLYESSYSGDDVFLTRLAADGSELWSRFFTGPDEHDPQDLRADEDGSFYLLGSGDSKSGYWSESLLDSRAVQGNDDVLTGEVHAVSLETAPMLASFTDLDGSQDSGVDYNTGIMLLKSNK